MSATPECGAVLVPLDTITCREELLAYANARGTGWREAIVSLVDRALSGDS